MKPLQPHPHHHRSTPREATLVSAALLASLLLGTLPALAEESGTRTLPESEVHPDFRQLLPRGRIAAIDKPVFVPAEEAEIADQAWILGVVIDGQARAYDLNLLNRHEVVNDKIGETAFAAVW